MPALEFEDGTVLAQGDSILSYVAEVYKLRPEDPKAYAIADSVGKYTWSDVIPKLAPKIFS